MPETIWYLFNIMKLKLWKGGLGENLFKNFNPWTQSFSASGMKIAALVSPRKISLNTLEM